MKHILATILFSLTLLGALSSAHAALSPVSINVLPPVQFPPDDFNVAGVRASILWGHQRNMYGLDLGLVGNITDQQFTGLAVAGIFNNTRGTTYIAGLQLAGIANYNTAKTYVGGIQAAMITNYNSAESSVNGLQLSLANIAEHTVIRGFQVGLYNKAQDVYGLQIGLVNMVSNLHGLQIGLINFNDNGMFKISPALNIGF